MPDLVLNFSAYAHASRHYFPKGRLTFTSDEAGNFNCVKVALVEPGKTMPPCNLSFTDRSAASIELLSVIRNCCENARTSGDIMFAGMMEIPTLVPLPIIARQIIESGIGYRILNKVIMDGKTVDPKSVELRAS